ncbi:FAD-dependent oxidoreductase [Halorubrum ezzemoulense]|jgi:cation diffusion facilitator CzcD-associated flavoprotein CzcO|uniref:FAD-dependent oxidoreductase n=3 Tax=Halorubrum ezzemoulense TaxID=337243 RepID=A0ABT4Z409_HALEZ|nr:MULTISPECIES: FAD-dependent oxidoreductase [Halorubrum]MDB2244944.1 FAD-dependent oxidoreductase [Halorubrum ezzemoulense]MDB2251151.1 FAD-dependent oxidoreductase [Halorubrum ezzemoulense]MDB2273715.1 FAD-dependent oxidoreductase [Halorubrum ezzemoulense]MDB2278299.1 FAD-dependent oxidoreductase [Halorubrum ezzemoulense]MDB2284973.1 FAD-dependent oxidoreductase [Halorubrum ezzemoulense]
MSGPAEPEAADRDVVVVGCGPAGCAAAVFAARDGLDVTVFDRGRSSLARCAHLENYPGFPAGVDVGTLSDLMREQAERAGCAVVDDLVETVERATDGGPGEPPEGDAPRFVVTPQEGDPVTARRVVAATRYDGEYLRGLDEDGAMFEARDRDGETREDFDREYADRDGKTPVEGLYVASPSDADRQAVTAAGRGARVGKRVVADARIDDGWWPAAAEGVDWVRREAEREGEWTDRERWVEWFDETHADGPVDPDSERFARVREAAVDDALSAYVDADEAAARAAAGHRALAERLDPEAVVDAHGPAALLDALDDGAVAAYAGGDGSTRREPTEARDER